MALWRKRISNRTVSLKPVPKSHTRIIGGIWRSRRLAFAAVEDVRPTPDRVRETVFNWLREYTEGARCLDLFAGSGAFGFEALSRGATQAVMVDCDSRVVRQIQENATLLGTNQAFVIASTAASYLQRQPQPFNIVFLDPPYQSDALAQCCTQLEQRGWLAPLAHIYIETPSAADLPSLPPTWQLQRSKKAGRVGYHLLERSAMA